MRARPHFTIRDLFWLTLVVALVVHWWISHPSEVKTDFWDVLQVNGTTIIQDHNDGRKIDTIPSDYGILVYGSHLSIGKDKVYAAYPKVPTVVIPEMGTRWARETLQSVLTDNAPATQ
jgi:hypothetical protein